MKKVSLLIGSNLGNKIYNIEQGFYKIEKYIGFISKKTSFLETHPWGYKSSNLFINCGIEILTNQSPIMLLKNIKKIEKKLGREKKLNSYEDRIIDIDIIFYENIFFWSKNLVIPHYLHLNKREFSKKILNELKKL